LRTLRVGKGAARASTQHSHAGLLKTRTADTNIRRLSIDASAHEAVRPAVAADAPSTVLNQSLRGSQCNALALRHIVGAVAFRTARSSPAVARHITLAARTSPRHI
jgi:hypothetical protein